MDAGIEVRKGIKVAAAEAEGLDPTQIVVLLPEPPPQAEVEAQTFCTAIQCPYCGKSGRCEVSPVPGKYYRCNNCGALFKT
jgi:predicted RNA-binding Zn-ribbon protein involved in translation (DUF1610 family)